VEIAPLQLAGLVVLVVAAYFLPRLVRRYLERLAKRQEEMLRARREAEGQKGGGPPAK